MEPDNLWFEYPTPQEYGKIERIAPFQALEDAREAFEAAMLNAADAVAGMERMLTNIQVQEQNQHLQNRIAFARRAYVRTRFYFDKGIPDDPYFVSPGPEGQSMAYFPLFRQSDAFRWWAVQFFDDAEVFYQKIFSAWDQIAHLLNIVYGLGLVRFDLPLTERHLAKKRVSFTNACQKLCKSQPTLGEDLDAQIAQHPAYEYAQQRRNDITHNQPLGSIYDMVETYVGPSATAPHQRIKSVSFSVGKYHKSAEVMDNMTQCLSLLTATLNIITHQPR